MSPSVLATRSRELDGLRGLAAIAVVLYHFGFRGFGGGWLGVDLFFVVSGYVVMLSILRRETSGSWSAGEFFVRRVTRLMPVIVAALAGVVVIALVDPNEPIPWLDLGATISMTYNGAIEVLPLEGTHLRHMWSLAVEWHFYLVAGVAFIPLLRWSRARFLRLLALTAVLVAIARLVVVLLLDDAFWAYTETPVRVDGLLVGVLLAFAPEQNTWSPKINRALSLASPISILAFLTLPDRWGEDLVTHLGFFIPVFTVVTAVFLFQVRTGTANAAVRQLLESRPFQWLGERSYSLYVWHFILGLGVLSPNDETFQGPGRFAAQVGFSLLAADLSFRFVEMPAQAWLNRHYDQWKPSQNSPSELSRS